ncbi:MAG: hypothetical protein J5862_03960, partial [Bacteroidales bacterium]|nr:hypothetical protein [Bacteroidales bacterium]
IEYEVNAGPLGIKVVDPLKVQARDYTIKFVDAGGEDVTDTTRWIIEFVNDKGVTDTIYSVNTISILNEQLILDHGLAISILDKPYVFAQSEVAANADLGVPSYPNFAKYGTVNMIGSSITYADASKPWYAAAYDYPNGYVGNWIRAGNQSSGAWEHAEGVQEGAENKYSQWRTEDAFIEVPKNTLNSSWRDRAWKDRSEQFESICYGQWAPYVLASPYDRGPQAKYINPDNVLNPTTEPADPYWGSKTSSGTVWADFTANNFNKYHYNQSMINLYSVNIVFTPDKSKWTRCVVLEACDDATKSIGGAFRFEPRKSPSVDQNGNPDGTGTGMGWFPGYAINIETGERLNIMFSENSADTANNGDDMLFNPTWVYGYNDEGEPINGGTYNGLHQYYSTIGQFPSGFSAPVYGGMHYVYIVGSAGNTNTDFYLSGTKKRSYNPAQDCGSYDEGAWLKEKFDKVTAITSHNDARKKEKNEIFNNVMWTSMAMASETQQWLSNEATVKIRVTRPYMRWSSYKGAEVENADNNNFPKYKFSTRSIAVQHNVLEVAQESLDKINVVPNPYYGFSTYESTALDNVVKIVNLPQTCNISIFTSNGTLVRRLSKGDSGSTYVDWNLKNEAGIPVASGVYIIHVSVPGVGEKTLKFFAAMRPTDLNAF